MAWLSKWLWVALPVVLAGCQPGADAPQSGAPPPPVVAGAQLPIASTNKIAPNASGEDVLNQAKIIGCMACHSLDKKLLGPSWKHVAGVYRADPEGEAKLMDKIAKGGSGVWGKIAMPAYPGLSESDLRALTRYILSLE